jgi:hypothetical protein
VHDESGAGIMKAGAVFIKPPTHCLIQQRCFAQDGRQTLA